MFFKLAEANSDIDAGTMQCLEIILGSFVYISSKMLKDHLKDGKDDKPSQEVIQQSKSTPTTNAEAERDFGTLDQLKKLKPKALDKPSKLF